MEAYHTNNDPTVVAGYYMDAVQNYRGCPSTLRMDQRTVNVDINTFHRFLRAPQNGDEPEHCVLIGSSTTNQRIESWWGQLRKESAEYYITLFKEMQSTGQFSGDNVDKELVRFCFLDLVQVNDSFWLRPCHEGKCL